MTYFSHKQSSHPIILPFTKIVLVKCRKREYLNCSTYGVSVQTLAVSAYTRSVTLSLQSPQKNRHSVDLLGLLNFGNPSGSGTNKERLQKSGIKKYF